MIYFTSDFHFGHDKDFIFKPRGFDDVKTHDQTIVDNFNKIVSNQDDLYILGDLMLNDNDYGSFMFNQLNGRKHIILGNHDSKNRISFYPELNGVIDIKYADLLEYQGYQFFLCHYPSKVGNYDDAKTKIKFYCLCGHTHTPDKFLDFPSCKAYHVELDAHDNKPVSIEQVIADIREYRNTHQ